MTRPPMKIALCAVLLACGCSRRLYKPDLATRPYPHELHTTDVVDMHVFRDGTDLAIFNSTATTYTDFDLWVNQRYVSHIDELPAGTNRRVSLWNFVDERGDIFNAGGFFRSFEPTPVRLVQIQTSDTEPMVGLIAIRAERD